ncbi:hypothetical protein AC1031_008503 [Aphanomyces cochlioides]|nr:hypothetical protein AC1031_008503 [Aphanomyces cochlioides]
MDLLEDRIAQFLFLVKSTQTKAFHEWNVAALHRAWEWALFARQASLKMDDETKAKLTDTFSIDVLPTSARQLQFEASNLLNAPREFLRAVIWSPFLLTHPLRGELFHALVDLYRQLPSQDGQIVFAELFVDITRRLQLEQTTSTLLQIGEMLAENDPPTIVSVAGREVHVISQSKWMMEKSSQRAICAAHALKQQILAQVHRHGQLTNKADKVTGLWAPLADFFNSSKATQDDFCLEKEIVIQATLLEWPNENTRQLVLDVIQQSVNEDPTRLLQVSPWLAGQVCHFIDSLALDYISNVIANGVNPAQGISRTAS